MYTPLLSLYLVSYKELKGESGGEEIVGVNMYNERILLYDERT